MATIEEEGITLILELEHTAIAREDIATRITGEGIGIMVVDRGQCSSFLEYELATTLAVTVGVEPILFFLDQLFDYFRVPFYNYNQI